MGTELTTTGVAALETELKAYRDCRSQTRKHLDSMGFPQITGTSTANLIVSTQLLRSLLELEVGHLAYGDKIARTRADME